MKLVKQRKILFILGSLKTGGAERNMAKVASEMADLGYHVEILLFENIIAFPVHSSIKITSINVLSAKNKLFKALKLYKGIFIYVWKFRPSYVIGFARISSQTIALSFYPRIIARFDSYPFDIKWYRTFFAILFFNFYNVKKVICPSLEIKKKLEPYFLNKKKLIVIGNPVDFKEILSENINLVLPRKFIVVVGRLSKLKQVHLIIDSFAKSKINKLFELVIVGDGAEYENLKNQANQTEMSNKIHFTGHLPDPSTVVSKASLLVLASVKEGFPTVLVEALSVGVPVLSSNCKTGPSEIIKNDINGWLFSLDDKMALVNKFDKIAENPSILDFVKKNSKISVEHFKTENIIALWNSILIK